MMRLKDYIIFWEQLIKRYGSTYSRIAPTHIILFGINSNKRLGIIEIETFNKENPIDFRTKDFFSEKASDNLKAALEELEIASINGSSINTLEIFLFDW